MDELSFSRILPGNLLLGEAPYFGGNSTTQVALYLFWERLFGLSPVAVRSLSVVQGLFGLALFWLALRRLFGPLWASWSTAFLSVSVYATYFAKVAFETGTVLFFGPFLLYLGVRWWKRPTAPLAAVLGAILAASFFTYPGFAVGLCAYGICFLLFLCFDRGKAGRWSVSGRRIAWVLGAFAVVMAALLAVHFQLAAHTKHLSNWLISAGAPSWKVSEVLSALLCVLYDAFVSGRSLHVFYPVPFLELFLWPFVFLAIGTYWRRYPNPAFRALAVCIPLVFFFASLATWNPGARRAIFALLPFYILAGGANLVQRYGLGPTTGGSDGSRLRVPSSTAQSLWRDLDAVSVP